MPVASLRGSPGMTSAVVVRSARSAIPVRQITRRRLYELVNSPIGFLLGLVEVAGASDGIDGPERSERIAAVLALHDEAYVIHDVRVEGHDPLLHFLNEKAF